MRHWNRLPRKVVDAPTLEMFKARMDKALSNLVQWEVFLPIMAVNDPLQPFNILR